MNDVLVLYASTHGHTAKIAARIADVLERAGATVDLRPVDSNVNPMPGEYAAVVAGASIHAGHHQRQMKDWVRRHATSLSAMPSAFFSVSLSAADDNEEARAVARKYIDDFVEETGWTPRRTVSFAGAVQYLEYDFFTRLLIKLMMHRGGHPTDASQDYDYTDWDAVADFGRRCAEMLPVPAGGPTASS
jgi:menaquinone-dependent protoporphyrinogen oxidase